MKNKWFAFALIFELLVSCSVSQGATVTHNDGLGGDAQAQLDSQDNAATFDGLFPDTTGPNHLFENSWFYRLPTSDLEIKLVPTTVDDTNNVITMNGSVEGVFSWTLVATLLDKPTANAASVDMSLTVNNISPQGPLSITIFNFNDFDLLETFGGDTQDLGSITQVRSHEGSIVADALAVGASAWEAGERNSVRGKFINAAVDNLINGAASFGPGDVASAFQWNTVISGEGQQTFSASLVISSTPEPNSFVLLAGGMSAVLRLRRRFRRA
jgi:hypothetical protein